MVFKLEKLAQINNLHNNRRFICNSTNDLSLGLNLSSISQQIECIDSKDSTFDKDIDLEETFDDNLITTSYASESFATSTSGTSNDDESSTDPDHNIQANHLRFNLMTQVCVEIEKKHLIYKHSIKDLSRNQTFWNYLLSSLDLLNLLNKSDANDELNYKSQIDFNSNLTKLMYCVNRIEKEIISTIESFDYEFTLNLIFMVYEMSCESLKKKQSLDLYDDETVVFELDLGNENSSGDLFQFEDIAEKILINGKNSLIEILTNEHPFNCRGDGKSVLRLLRGKLVANGLLSFSGNQKATDISEILFKTIENENEATLNPIVHSYKPLLKNLDYLNMFSFDPYTEAEENAANFGYEADTTTMACLGLSYYTMGHFAIRNFFFENSFQFLHELREFYHEFECIFRNDDPFRFETDMEHEANLLSTKDSKWNTSSQAVEISNTETDLISNSIFEDILTRISSLKETDQSLNHKSKEWQSINFTMPLIKKETTRNWTVAPKLLQEGYSPSDQSDSKCRVYDLKSNKNWSKNDLRPIGTKSASMSSVKNYNNRYENKGGSFSMESNVNLAEKFNKNVWYHDTNEKDLFKQSSFSGIGLYAFFNPEDSLITHNVSRLEGSNFLTNNEKIMSNKPVQNANELLNRGKYSVAPLTLHTQNNSNNIKQNHSFPNNKRRQNTQSFSYNEPENSPLTRYPLNRPNRRYHNSISRQYSNDSNDSYHRSSPNSYYQENSGQRSNKNKYKIVNNHSNKSNYARSGGKTVYNNDAYTNNTFRDSFKNSFSDNGSFQNNSRFLRR